MSTAREESPAPGPGEYVHYAEHWIDNEARGAQAPTPRGWVADLYTIAEVMFAGAQGPPPPERLRWLCARTERFAREVGGKGVLAFRMGLALVEYVAPLMILRPPPFRDLSFEERLEALEAFERSPLGMTLFAVKAVASVHYFEHPDVADVVGFDAQSLGSHGYPSEEGETR